LNEAWIADRMKHIEASGIRKAFDMAQTMVNPINLSIGLPDFDVAPPVKAAAIEAISGGFNAYTVTQGIPALREKSFRLRWMLSFTIPTAKCW
jgi:aspartate/methionine/tyrosine aminotransferase